MFKILVTDDEDRIRELIKKYAQFEGYTVVEANNGMEAVQICQTQTFDLIIMDIMMPELDGFSAVKEIKKTLDCPIIMLSARGEEYDKIHGFEIGIDDYVVKPFSPKELMMRVRAIMKRSVKTMNHDIFEANRLKVDFTARKVLIDQQELTLSPKEFDLLFYMIKNQNIALTREQLITKVWGYDYYGDDRTLDTHIKQLRKQLGDYASCIVTLRGIGYRFEVK